MMIEKSMNGKGRVVVRYSGTEPKLRILVEGRDAELVQSTGDELAEIVKKEIGA